MSLPLVEVTWTDAFMSQDGWQPVEDYVQQVNADPGLTQSVGYLIVRNKEWVAIAASYGPKDGHVADVMQIPRGMVRKVRRLR